MHTIRHYVFINRYINFFEMYNLCADLFLLLLCSCDDFSFTVFLSRGPRLAVLLPGGPDEQPFLLLRLRGAYERPAAVSPSPWRLRAARSGSSVPAAFTSCLRLCPTRPAASPPTPRLQRAARGASTFSAAPASCLRLCRARPAAYPPSPLCLRAVSVSYIMYVHTKFPAGTPAVLHA